MACSGDVLLNDAKSEASVTKSVEKLASASPVNPAALPKVAKVAAASSACCLVCPRDVAAPSANFSIFLAVSPKRTPTLETVSDRSDAALTASIPTLTAKVPAATAAAAKAAAATLPKFASLLEDVSTSLFAAFNFLLRSSTSARMESLRVLLPAINPTPLISC